MTSVDIDRTKADLRWFLADDHGMALTICQWYEIVLHCTVLKTDISLTAAADLREGVFVVVEAACDIGLEAGSCEPHPASRVGCNSCVRRCNVQGLQGDIAEVKVDSAHYRNIPAGVSVGQLQAGKFLMNELQADFRSIRKQGGGGCANDSWLIAGF